MARRAILLLLSAILCCTMLFAGTALAQPNTLTLSVTAQHALLIDADSGEEWFVKAADDKLFPASTTKLLTGLIVLEKAQLDDVVTCGSEVTTFGSASSLMGLSDGEQVTVKDLLHGLMLVSGNDAAAALAVYVGGSISGFADLMNQKAAEFGMSHSHFVNPHGVQSDDHYSTARDMGKLARKAYANASFMEIMGKSEYTTAATNKSAARTLYNTNKLISTRDTNTQYYYANANGMKTGMTTTALNCLVASATRDGISLIALLYEDNSENGVDRWTDSASLFDAGFVAVSAAASAAADIDLQQVLSTTQITLPIEGVSAALAVTPSFDAAALANIPASVQRAISADPASVTVKTQVTRTLDDTVLQGDNVGTATYEYQGNTIATANLAANQDVAALRSAPQSGGPSFWLILLVIVLVIALLWFILGMIRAVNERKRAARKRAARRKHVSRH